MISLCVVSKSQLLELLKGTLKDSCKPYEIGEGPNISAEEPSSYRTYGYTYTL